MKPNFAKLRILFEAPLHVPHIGVETFCYNAFASLGCKVQPFEFWKPLKPVRRGPGNRAVAAGDSSSKRIAGNRIPFYQAIKTLFNELRLRRAEKAFRPDILFVLGGKWMPPEVISRFKKRSRARTVCWAIDDPQLIHLSLQFARVYDKFFTDDPYSVSTYKRFGIDVEALNFGCDPVYHKTVPLLPEERRRFGANLVFNGSLYPDRIRFLESVADLGLAIWGLHSDPIRDNPVLWPCYRGDCSIEELVKIYNASKLLINPHLNFGQTLEKRGTWANLRLFEAAGAGIFQLVDRKPAIEQCFREGSEIIFFDSAQELRQLAIRYLQDEAARLAIARSAQRRAHAEHTFVHRMRDLLHSTMKRNNTLAS